MNDKKTIFSSFVWKFSERLLSQGVGLIIQILIARMIKPEAVGEMAILLSVINIFSVIAQSGFSSYIIQKKDLSDESVSSVAIFSILVASACILLLCGGGNFLMGLHGTSLQRNAVQRNVHTNIDSIAIISYSMLFIDVLRS